MTRSTLSPRSLPRAVMAVLVVATSGCAGGGDDDAGHGHELPDGGTGVCLPVDGVALSLADGHALTFSSSPDPIPLNELFTLDVAVDAPDDAGVADALELVIGARMPAHGHGMNTTPVVTRPGPAQFHVEGMAFHMPGRWKLTAELSTPAVDGGVASVLARGDLSFDCDE